MFDLVPAECALAVVHTPRHGDRSGTGRPRIDAPSDPADTRNVTLILPESLEARLSSQATALHLAIGLFVTEEATLGQAAQVAGMSQGDFLRELGRRRIPIHYGSEELATDLRTVESLASR